MCSEITQKDIQTKNVSRNERQKYENIIKSQDVQVPQVS